MIKALLLQAALEIQHGEASISDDFIRPYYVERFYIALGLNKAFQYGPQTTRLFLRNLMQCGYIREDEFNPHSLAVQLEDYTNFEFRGSRDADMLNEIATTPSSDLVSPAADDPSYIKYADLAIRTGSRHVKHEGY